MASDKNTTDAANHPPPPLDLFPPRRRTKSKTREKRRKLTSPVPSQITIADATSASAIRIRENQRRSRARRKEYVETMERKIQEYERRGVDATLEMQHAARSVAVENARLRVMLAQMGAAAADVDAFLQAFQDRDAAHTLSSVRFRQGQPPSSPCSSSTAASSETVAPALGCCHEFARLDDGSSCRGGGHVRGTSLVAIDVPRGNTTCPPILSVTVPVHGIDSRRPTPHPWTAFDKLDVLAAASIQQGSGDDADGSCAPVPALRSTRAESPSTVAPSPGAATPSSQGASIPGSPLSMSCDAAAQIIAEMQGCAAGRSVIKEEPEYGGDGQTLAGGGSSAVILQVLESNSQFP